MYPPQLSKVPGKPCMPEKEVEIPLVPEDKRNPGSEKRILLAPDTHGPSFSFLNALEGAAFIVWMVASCTLAQLPAHSSASCSHPGIPSAQENRAWGSYFLGRALAKSLLSPYLSFPICR